MFINKTHEEAYLKMKSGDYSAALILYDQCLQQTSDQDTLHSERAVVYLHLNQKEKSLADFDRSIALNPLYGYHFAARGHAKDFFGDIDGAIADYERAIELEPEDDIFHNNLGLLQEKKGNQVKAQAYFERSDKLRKAEEKLHALIDEIEGKESTSEPPFSADEKLQSSATNKPDKWWGMASKVLFDRKLRAEYWQFIKNGFKLK